jgi:hypothetical protein
MVVEALEEVQVKIIQVQVVLEHQDKEIMEVQVNRVAMAVPVVAVAREKLVTQMHLPLKVNQPEVVMAVMD